MAYLEKEDDSNTVNNTNLICSSKLCHSCFIKTSIFAYNYQCFLLQGHVRFATKEACDKVVEAFSASVSLENITIERLTGWYTVVCLEKLFP